MVQIFKAQKKAQSTGQVINVDIERLDFNGAGVGYFQKKPVFIDGALPTENVSAKIIEQKSKFSRATLVKVNKASDKRIKPVCQHFERCGGCDLQHLSMEEQWSFKQQKVSDLFSRNGVEIDTQWQPIIHDESFHYRRKARIGVQYDKQGVALVGFRGKSTNQVIKINSCPVLMLPMSDIFSKLQQVIRQMPRSQTVGHVEVLYADEYENDSAIAKIQLVIRQLKTINQQDISLWQSVAIQHQWQVFIDDGNQVTALEDCLSEVAINSSKTFQYQVNEDIKIAFKTSDFIQVNHNVNCKMVEQAIGWLALETTDNVLDLFCGLGNFSLPIAKQVQQVTGVEGVEDMVVRATENARLNQLDNINFYQADLNATWQALAWAKSSFNKIILDPARAGALEAIEQITHYKAELILYVSCDPATLARDAKLLLTNGYQIEKISLIDMFSQTKHIETMVLFRKKK